MLIVNLAGALLIVLIVWWFWLYKPKAVEQSEAGFSVVVENGIYSPSRIKLKTGEQHALKFLRKDASPCAEMLLIPQFDIAETLIVNQTTTIRLPEMSAGEYEFHCQMKMYKGVLVVE